MKGGGAEKTGNHIDANAEFRRAYAILAVFAILVIGAFIGTQWERSNSPGADVVTLGSSGAVDDGDDFDLGADEVALSPRSEVLDLEASEEEPRDVTAVEFDREGERPAPEEAAAAEVAPAPKKKKAKPPVSPELNFTQPQSICPGSPTTKGIGTGGPRQNKAVIQEILEKLGDGWVPESTSDVRLIKSGKFKYTKIECPFLTRDCASVTTHTGKQAAAKMKQSGARWNATAQNFLDLKPGSLGSCALIGNSENMLKYEWGPAIDAHDTVIRHNTPVGKYAKHVGKKATIVWVKGRYKGGGSAKASLAYLVPKNVDELPKNFKKNGKPIIIRGIGAKPLDKTKRLLYHLQGANLRRKHPTGGYSRPLNVIASGLCTRVDLYGFGSRNSSGKYFKKSAKVRPAHMMAYEHWTFRYMMHKGKVCVYGEWLVVDCGLWRVVIIRIMGFDFGGCKTYRTCMRGRGREGGSLIFIHSFFGGGGEGGGDAVVVVVVNSNTLFPALLFRFSEGPQN